MKTRPMRQSSYASTVDVVRTPSDGWWPRTNCAPMLGEDAIGKEYRQRAQLRREPLDSDDESVHIPGDMWRTGQQGKPAPMAPTLESRYLAGVGSQE
jgi:hypothetical protein